MVVVPEIFLNYRQPEAYAALALDDRLSRIFGADSVFRASRSIALGRSFDSAILEAIANARVMLVLIGPTWARQLRSRVDASGSRKLGWVEREIVTARDHEVPLVPVLMSNVRLLEKNLPDAFKELARLQYLRFGYRTADQDAMAIARSLMDLVPTLKPRRSVSLED
jgi:hypothetical protein